MSQSPLDPNTETEEPPTCWICLDTNTDETLSGYRKGDLDFLRLCNCSLIAHRKCLFAWINEGGKLVDSIYDVAAQLDKRKLRTIQPEAPMRPEPRQGLFGAIVHPFRQLFTWRNPIYSFNNVAKCPQCKQPIYVFYQPSRLAKLISTVTSKVMYVGQTMALSGLGSYLAICAFTSVALYSFRLSTTILNVICPKALQSSLFTLGATGSIDNAFKRDKLDARQFLSVALLPIYMLGLRTVPDYKSVSELAMVAYALGGTCAKSSDFIPLKQRSNLLEPRKLLAWTYLARTVYNLTYSTSFNLIYYKWAVRRFGSLGNIATCFTYDWSHYFINYSTSSWLLTTFMWPYAGKFVSEYFLSYFTDLNNLGTTPNHSLLIRNTVGCLIVVILKDFAQLGLAWLHKRVIEKMDFLEKDSELRQYIDTKQKQ